MFASLFQLSLLLAPAQMPLRPMPTMPAGAAQPEGPANSWTISPALNRAQELVYRGTYKEDATGPRVQFSRGYRLDARVFVTEVLQGGYEMAFLTVLKARESQGGPVAAGFSDSHATTTRLEIARVDAQGNFRTGPLATMLVPLDSPPSVEVGMFVPAPKEHVTVHQEWQVAEAKRPPLSWSIVGKEMVGGASCLKLVGQQQSEDWDHPRADRTAWQRLDTVWIQPKLGYASRVERVIKVREAGLREPNQVSTLRYELESSLSYPGTMYESRREEITHARAFADNAAPLLAAPEKYKEQINFLYNKITKHLDTPISTPYREAILQTRRRLEAARRGDTPVATTETLVPQNLVASLGFPAPDYVTTQFTSKEAARPRLYLGRPVLMVFYNPAASTAEPLLTYAQRLSDQHAGKLVVLPLSVSDDSDMALRQREALKLTLPILSGSGLRISYAIETTPKMVLIDAAGIVRGSYLGWGREIPQDIAADLKTWMQVPLARPSGPMNR